MGPHVSGRRPSATASHAHAASPEADAMAFKYPASAPPPCRAPQTASPALLCSCRFLPFRIPGLPATARRSPTLRHRHHHHHQAMDAFLDGGFVRLESRTVSGKFLHADEDWERVSLRSNNAAVPALNAVWQVQHWVEEGETYVLLQNAAYGRYLSYSTSKEQLDLRGFRVIQRDRSEPKPWAGVLPRLQNFPWMWRVQRLPEPNQAYVSLRFFTCYLCANNSFISWNTYVTADLDLAAPRVSTAKQWTVRPIEASAVPRPLPLTLQDQGVDDGYPRPARTIRYVQANDEGQFDQNHHNWPSFAYIGSSVMILKRQLGLLQSWTEDVATYTLCMRPGSHGRLMPLVTDDLPSSLDSMNIVVLKTGTPGAAALRYPAPVEDDNAP